MLRIGLRDIWAHRGALLLACVAIVVGTGFISAVLTLSDTFEAGTTSVFDTAYARSDYVVLAGTPSRPTGTPADWTLDHSLVDEARAVPGVADVAGFTSVEAQVVDTAGRPVVESTYLVSTFAGSWVPSPDLNPFHVVDGGPPRGAGDVVIDERTAGLGGYRVGDRVAVQTPDGVVDPTISGIARFGDASSPGGAGVVLFAAGRAQELAGNPGRVDQVHVALEPDARRAEVSHDLTVVVASTAPQAEVRPTGEWLEEVLGPLRSDVASSRRRSLGNSAFALTAGGFVMATTLVFVTARRRRELALLRALGASRTQVVTTVVVQALVVGAMGSAVGYLAGVAAADAIVGRLDARDLAPGGHLLLQPASAAVTIAVGVGVSVLTTVIPAVAAARRPPLAGLRDVTLPARTRGLPRVLAGAGCAAAAIGLVVARPPRFLGDRTAYAYVLALCLAALLVVMPLVVAFAGRTAQRRLGRTNAVGRFGAVAAATYAQRTARSAAPVVVGVSTVVFSAVQLASYRSDTAENVERLNRSTRADYVIENALLPDGAVDRLDALDQVSAAAGLRLGAVEAGGREATIMGTRPAPARELLGLGASAGSLAALDTASVAVTGAFARASGLMLGDVIDVEFATGASASLRVVALFEATPVLYGDLLTVPEVFSQHVPGYGGDTAAWIAVADGVGPAAAEVAIDSVLRPYGDVHATTVADAADRAGDWASRRSELDDVVALLTALLAVVGAVNGTLLGALERRREHALLRAVGATRRQLARSLQLEMVLAATVGVAAAVVVAVGAAGVLVAVDPGVNNLRVPAGVIAGLAVGAVGLVAVAAGVPARWAARRSVVASLGATGEP